MAALRLVLVAFAALAVVSIFALPQGERDEDADLASLSPNARRAEEQLRALWQDDTLDREAKKERKAEIMKALNEEERAEVKALHKQQGRHGGSDHQDRLKQLGEKLEERLAKLSPNARRVASAMKDVWLNDQLTYEEKLAKKAELRKGLSADEQEEIKSFWADSETTSEHEQRLKQLKEKLEERLAKLSPNARRIATAMKDVWMNDQLTFAEKQAKKAELRKGLTDAERVEVSDFWEDKEHQDRLKELGKKLDERLAKLSPNARRVASAMKDVWMDDQLTFEEKLAKKAQLRKGLTDAENEEIRLFWEGH